MKNDEPLPLNTLKYDQPPRRLEFNYKTGELQLVAREEPKPPSDTVVCDVIYQQGFFASREAGRA